MKLFQAENDLEETGEIDADTASLICGQTSDDDAWEIDNATLDLSDPWTYKAVMLLGELNNDELEAMLETDDGIGELSLFVSGDDLDLVIPDFNDGADDEPDGESIEAAEVGGEVQLDLIVADDEENQSDPDQDFQES